MSPAPKTFDPPATFRLQGHDYELLGEINPKLPGISVYRRPPGFDKTDPRDKEGVCATGDLKFADGKDEQFYYLPCLVGPPVSTHPYKDAIRQTSQWRELGRDDLAVKAVEALFGPPPASTTSDASSVAVDLDVTKEFDGLIEQGGFTSLPGSTLPKSK